MTVHTRPVATHAPAGSADDVPALARLPVRDEDSPVREHVAGDREVPTAEGDDGAEADADRPVDRRDFVKAGAVAGALGTAGWPDALGAGGTGGFGAVLSATALSPGLLVVVLAARIVAPPAAAAGLVRWRGTVTPA